MLVSVPQVRRTFQAKDPETQGQLSAGREQGVLELWDWELGRLDSKPSCSSMTGAGHTSLSLSWQTSPLRGKNGRHHGHGEAWRLHLLPGTKCAPDYYSYYRDSSSEAFLIPLPSPPHPTLRSQSPQEAPQSCASCIQLFCWVQAICVDLGCFSPGPQGLAPRRGIAGAQGVSA